MEGLRTEPLSIRSSLYTCPNATFHPTTATRVNIFSEDLDGPRCRCNGFKYIEQWMPLATAGKVVVCLCLSAGNTLSLSRPRPLSRVQGCLARSVAVDTHHVRPVAKLRTKTDKPPSLTIDLCLSSRSPPAPNLMGGPPLQGGQCQVRFIAHFSDT
jgi:hypothetical protein